MLFSVSVLATEKLVIAGDNFPPYLDRTAANYGWAWHIARLALEQSQINHQFEFAPWARVLESAAQGKRWQAVFPAYYSAERAKHFYYSEPVISTQLGLFKLRKNKDIIFNDDFSSLDGYTIGNCRNCAVREDFDASTTIDKVVTNNLESGIRMLLAGRIDLLVGNYHVSQAKIVELLKEDTSYSLTIEDIEFMLPVIQEKPLYLAISKQVKGHKELIKRFNKSLKSVKTQAEVLQIYQLNEPH